MKKYALPISFLLVFLLPNLLFSYFRNTLIEQDPANETADTTPVIRNIIHVQDHETVLEMELEEYVVCVLLGEMPADFENEALKAQAVAARTYTLRKVLKQNVHEDADVCTDPTCCQAFVSRTEYLDSGKKQDDLRKIELAVNETEGQVLTYEGNLIEATYFSCSGGKTEDAIAVWGTEIPYLKSVESPGEENAAHYEDSVVLSKKQFCAKLGLSGDTTLSKTSVKLQYTSGGGVEKMTVADCIFTGTQLRTLLSLPSTAITLTFTDDAVIITTKGNGHRVGLSQYGADAMAVVGKTYKEILEHYYSGTELVTFTSEQIQGVFDKAGNL